MCLILKLIIALSTNGDQTLFVIKKNYSNNTSNINESFYYFVRK